MKTALILGLLWTGLIVHMLENPTGPGCDGDPEWLGYCSEVAR